LNLHEQNIGGIGQGQHARPDTNASNAAHKRLPFANDFSKRHFGIRKKGCKTIKVNNQT
jgi:hypothetical protein